MSSPRRLRVAHPGAVVVTILSAALALVAEAGCTNNCSIACPPTAVYIGTLDNSSTTIAQVYLDGPACPPAYGLPCTAAAGGGCPHFTITGQKAGTCDVGIVFQDRPAEIVHLEFGPHMTGECCAGFPVLGDSTFVVPANSDAGITGVISGADAVTIVVDAAASDGPDAGPDGDADGSAD